MRNNNNNTRASACCCCCCCSKTQAGSFSGILPFPLVDDIHTAANSTRFCFFIFSINRFKLHRAVCVAGWCWCGSFSSFPSSLNFSFFAHTQRHAMPGISINTNKLSTGARAQLLGSSRSLSYLLLLLFLLHRQDGGRDVYTLPVNEFCF